MRLSSSFRAAIQNSADWMTYTENRISFLTFLGAGLFKVLVDSISDGATSWFKDCLLPVSLLGRTGKEASLGSPLWPLIPAPEFHDNHDLISENHRLLIPPL